MTTTAVYIPDRRTVRYVSFSLVTRHAQCAPAAAPRPAAAPAPGRRGLA
jgi:hypothetical protein